MLLRSVLEALIVQEYEIDDIGYCAIVLLRHRIRLEELNSYWLRDFVAYSWNWKSCKL